MIIAAVTASNQRAGHEKFSPSHIVDGDTGSYWAADDGVFDATLEIELGETVYFDRVMLQEPIRFGQRIASFAIEARMDGRWISVAEGTTIDYRLRVHGLPLRWRSLISSWQPPFEFIDEQVMGPYRSWVHLHSFRETEHGVVVRDRVEYSVPGGALIHTLFVRRDLERIFDHRRESLASLLPDG